MFLTWKKSHKMVQKLIHNKPKWWFMRKNYSKMIITKCWEAKVKFSFTAFTVGDKFDKKDLRKKVLPPRIAFSKRRMEDKLCCCNQIFYQISSVVCFSVLWKYVICFQKELSNLI